MSCYNSYLVDPCCPPPIVNPCFNPCGVPAPQQHCNPCVPLIAPIGPCMVGRTFRISGVSGGCSRFSVNFMCGPSFECDDVAFSMDVRFNHRCYSNQVHRSTKVCGQWAVSEKSLCRFPFSPNCPFELVITVTECGFRVEVNCEHFLDYQHKIFPLQRITYFCIMGDVRLSNVSC